MATSTAAVKRQAQIDALGGGVSTTMPVGGAPQVIPQPTRETPSAGNTMTGDFGRMHGYDANNWNNGMDSVKYKAGRVMSKYDPKPSSLPQVLADPEFQAAFPNAKQVGKDSIDFGGALSDGDSGSPVGVIDVGEAFDDTNDTGNAWWWGWDTGNAVQPNGGLQGNAAPFNVSQFDALSPNADESLAALIAQMMGQNQRGAILDALGM